MAKRKGEQKTRKVVFTPKKPAQKMREFCTVHQGGREYFKAPSVASARVAILAFYAWNGMNIKTDEKDFFEVII
jgi:hypothetical protein